MADAPSKKSFALQFALAAVLGPVGLLYSSPIAGISLFFFTILLGLYTGGWGGFLTWPISIVTGFFTVRGYNRRVSQGAGEAMPAPDREAPPVGGPIEQH